MAEGSKSLQALQEFLILGKSAPGAAAVANIQKCISSPNCFVFAELLELQHVQALANDGNPEHAMWSQALKLFAYGSYMDYKKNRETEQTLPELNEPQLVKLKQLSLITIASKQPELLSYSSLQALLDIPTIRALEDLVISAIYADLLDAKLDTAAQRVEVSSTASRDVASGDIDTMIQVLSAWTKQCEGVLQEIDGQILAIQKNAVAQRKEQDDFENRLAEKKKSVMNNAKDGGGGIGKGKRVIDGDDSFGYPGNGEDEMDVDDGPFAEGDGGMRKPRKSLRFGRKRW